MIIVLDIGTSNVRAVLVDPKGTLVCTQNRKYSLSYPTTHAVEMDLTVFNKALWEVLGHVCTYARNRGIDIEAISVTGQRSSVIAVDKEGSALGPAIMWQDTRAQYICDRHASQLEHIYALTGMRPSPVFSAPKIQFVREQMPELYEKSEKLVGFCEYSLHLLTKNFATDYSIASRTCLFDITTRSWSDYLLGLFAIDTEKLCPLVEVGSVVGTTTREVTEMLSLAKPVPVISAGGDQQCAALGLGCMHPGTYMINEGSGMYAIGISHTPIFDEAMGTNCNLSAIPGRYIIEGAVLSAGKTVDWLNDLLFASQDESYPYERFTLASRSAKPGSHGLRFSVHLAGKGTPNWDPSAHGALFHLSLMQRKEDMARAVLEGLAVSAKECLDHVVRVNRIPADVIHISGGLAKDSFFNQMLSDFLQKPLKRYLVGQATVFGAWISASVSMGLQPDYNTCFNVISTSLEEELYSPSQEHHELYRKIEKEILSYEHTVEE